LRPGVEGFEARRSAAAFARFSSRIAATKRWLVLNIV
jgi:hypothetical protein